MHADRGPTLPLVDEHSVTVAAPAAAVWRQLGASLPSGRATGWFAAHVLGTRPDRAHGDPLVEGSTIPGFAIEEAVTGSRLVLRGRHRFSDYRLTFTLTGADGTTRLAARSEASFPGLLGTAYRAAVIGSGGHRVLVARWLRRIARAAEADLR
jgi:hypothetical protein